MSSTLLSKAAANDAATSPTTLERVTIPISGMTCAAYQSFVQRTLAGEAGVQDVSVNLMLHNATVVFDSSAISTAGLVETVRGTGYGAEIPALDQSILNEQENMTRTSCSNMNSCVRKLVSVLWVVRSR